MKNIKRLALGIISSVLLAAGFARSADRLDPMNQDFPAVSNGPAAPAPDTSSFCNVSNPAPDTSSFCNVDGDAS